MEKFIIFTEGLKLEKGFSFTFANGFKLCHFDEIDDNETKVLLETFTQHSDYYVLYQELSKEIINQSLIENARDILDIISIHLVDYVPLNITAASNYATSNIPRLHSRGIRIKLSEEILETSDRQLTNLNKLDIKEKNKVRVSLRFLNKSKERTNLDTSIDHAIFIRVAMENIFGAPHGKIRTTIAERAPILLPEFNPTELISGFKKFYDQTSKAIHTGTVIPKPVKNKDKKVIIDGKNMYQILTLSVSKILDNGYPNWEEEKLPFRYRLKRKLIKIIDENL